MAVCDICKQDNGQRYTIVVDGKRTLACKPCRISFISEFVENKKIGGIKMQTNKRRRPAFVRVNQGLPAWVIKAGAKLVEAN